MPTEKQKSAPASWRSKSHPPQKNSWQALRATSEKTARMGGNFRICSDLVQFYTFARTEFQRSCE